MNKERKLSVFKLCAFHVFFHKNNFKRSNSSSISFELYINQSEKRKKIAFQDLKLRIIFDI